MWARGLKWGVISLLPSSDSAFVLITTTHLYIFVAASFMVLTLSCRQGFVRPTVKYTKAPGKLRESTSVLVSATKGVSGNTFIMMTHNDAVVAGNGKVTCLQKITLK